MAYCSKCGTQLREGAKFCPKCGTPCGGFREPKCPHCGSPLNEGDAFCTKCGKRVDEVPKVISSEPAKTVSSHCKSNGVDYPVISEKTSASKSLLLLFLVLAIAGGGWYVWNNHKNDNSSVQDPFFKKTFQTEGNAVMLIMDISTSMLAEDVKPNRIEAVKKFVRKYVESHPADSIGVVAFAGESYTVIPLTDNLDELKNKLETVTVAVDSVIEDGTAIGEGIANGISNLSKSQSEHKMIIVFTDGSNNRGRVSPMMAAEIAKSLGIRVYTIGVGSNKDAPYPMPVGDTVLYVKTAVKLDSVMLNNLAIITGGQYFNVKDTTYELFAAYKQIERIEESRKEKSGTLPTHNRKQINIENAKRILNAVARKDRRVQQRIMNTIRNEHHK